MADMFDTCFGEYRPAADVLAGFPANLSQAREDAALEAARGGDVPYFNRQWVAVPVSGGGHTGVVYVTPDYFSVGTDSDYVRVPLNPVTAEAVGRLVGARLPTKKVVDDVHNAAPQKLAASPKPPGAQMTTTDYFVEHSRSVDGQFAAKGYRLGVLTSGHKKDVVVSAKMDGAHVCIYGWFTGASTKTAVQGPTPNCKSHELAYADYSHGVRLVRDTMLVDGVEAYFDDVMRDPALHVLVSDEGVFKGTRYTVVPPTSGPGGGGVGEAATFLAFLGLGFAATGALLGRTTQRA